MPVGRAGIDALRGVTLAALAPASSRPRPSGRVGWGPIGDFPDPRAAGREDLRTLQAIVDGHVSAHDGLVRISQSGGLPIVVDGKTVFVSDASETQHVAGDFNGWSPAAMERRGGVQVLEVKGEQTGRYKLVAGSDWRADPWSRRYAFDDHGEISIGQRQGGRELLRIHGVSGFGLAPRTVRLLVPAGEATHHLYMHDGQNLFHPNAMFGGWRVDEAVGDKTLVVALDNTSDRMDEYTHVRDKIDDREMGGRGDDYARLVVDLVKPMIERNFGAPRKVGVMGSSLGGLVSFHIASKYPNTFDFVGAMSPTFWWGGSDSMLERYRAQPFMRRPKFYVDSGGSPGGRDNHDAAKEMAGILDQAGYRWERDLWHWHEPDAAHNEMAWARRVWRPLKLFEGL